MEHIFLRLQGPYRNRKGVITQNVLAVVDFNMSFTYALIGWEGSAHDSKVLNDDKLNGLPMLYNKFYLADAGYALYHANASSIKKYFFIIVYSKKEKAFSDIDCLIL